ncbi:MAG TPA: hypothetical protein VLM85_23870 [Polyangiaceae bacterium]|nr:hypothetical protein [Polyangiaceae bacterium]
MRRLLVALAALAAVHEARADVSDAGAPARVTGCVEIIPQGAVRPEVTETLPERGRSGYAATLVVTIRHGKGETVLPSGLSLQSSSEAAEQIKQAGWVFPDQDGSAGARLATKPDPAQADRVTTTLELPLVALPDKPGRHVLTLPPLPIAVARASGQVATVCTHEHRITIEDPTAETPDPQPRPNPPARAQREEWTALKRAVIYGSLGIAVGVLLAWLVSRWLRRPRPAPPPPPPRPPWDVALEKLDEVRHAGLLEVQRFSEYYDRVGDAVRQYFGGRYGFDGLECTTDEMLTELRRSALTGIALPEIAEFLQQCDLVKFARMTPSQDDCKKALDEAERIVRTTMVTVRREAGGDRPPAPPAPPRPPPPEAPARDEEAT